MAWRVYNYGGNRIGDKIGASALISYQIEEKGDRFILIDPTWDSHNSFPIKQFFPQISNFVIETKNAEDIHNTLREKGFDGFDTGNIWITAPSLKKDTGYTPTMFIPTYIKRFVETLVVQSEDGQAKKKLLDFDLKIVSHCLVDPSYNTGRQHNPAQWGNFMKRIREYLEKEKIDGVVVDIPQYDLPFQQVIGIISAGDVLIHGDTGTGHVGASLGKELISIYGDDSHDVKAFEPQRVAEERSHSWCSDPLTDKYRKFVMVDHKFDEDAVFEYLKEKIDEHLSKKVVIN